MGKRNNAVCKLWTELDAQNVALRELYIQRIWDMIPTDQQEVFDYKLDWNEIERKNISEKMRKWTTDWWRETFTQENLSDVREFADLFIETITNATIKQF